MNIQQVHIKSNSFPSLLRNISTPPKLINIVGTIPELPMIAIVGSRKPTNYGRAITYRISYDLARAGFCIVSGLALGIDTIAHQAALEAGGKTIAVMGCGLSQIYPISNRNLALAIIQKNGAIISEFDHTMPALKQNFPARNRIIAGLSLATIVTEADAKSGSLITANNALNENRLVMAVPGNTTSLRSAGPNNLIKNGAKLITDACDVLAELGLESKTITTKPIKADSKEEALIIEVLTTNACNTQQLIKQTKLEAAQLASILSLMEITGKIRNLGAGTWILA